MNVIPTAAVNTIEVLRDGASAQYGSDAIAGVINVRLRENPDGGDLTLTYGQRESSYDVPTGTPPAGATWSAPPRSAATSPMARPRRFPAGRASLSVTPAS